MKIYFSPTKAVKDILKHYKSKASTKNARINQLIQKGYLYEKKEEN